ncbi:MAG: ATP-dependent DNA helicase RecQ [Bacteroidota bacterium]|nr:ATP-dependent DNA helicase RecQ [Bacteroidota bacterium]
MQPDLHQILKQYWGYNTFRKGQEDIINSVIAAKDTIALLPTGGGKSLCFQIPALAMEGICIVVSPLVALMKDQTDRLKKIGIKAELVYSGKSSKEIDRILDNCIFAGDIKFLYTSPERLQNPVFQARFERMNVNLIAVDEAHCISQWGYDFRPEYLKIAELRKIKPNIPIIAVTASATPAVVKDIAEKLWLKDPIIYKSSFERANLSYVVRETDDKTGQLLQIVDKIIGTTILYANNRKATKEIALLLNKNGYQADYYHAGLTMIEREKKQNDWLQNKIRIMCCTNAFGMGIDKADVRLVIHYEMPDSIEAYYQEAGRAGRDGNKSFAVLLTHPADEEKKKEMQAVRFPEFSFIQEVYNHLCSQLMIPWGEGQYSSYDFEIGAFCKKYNYDTQTTYSALKILEQNQWLKLNDAIHEPSKVMILSDEFTLYKLEVENPVYDTLLKFLLRSYGGILDHYIIIQEEQIAAKIKWTTAQVIELLNKLKKLEVLDYTPRKDNPQIYFLEDRIKKEDLLLDTQLINFLKTTYITRQTKMLEYTKLVDECRSNYIRDYFADEGILLPCGICDNCIANRKKLDNNKSSEEKLLKLLYNNPTTIADLVNNQPSHIKNERLAVIRKLLDDGELLVVDAKLCVK